MSLKKVPVQNRNNLVKYLHNVKGLFVCILNAFPNSNNTHAIGVDCNVSPKLIWDSCEKTALKYCTESLDVCVGPNSSFHCVAYIGEIKIEKNG